jgi:hypothetical protein
MFFADFGTVSAFGLLWPGRTLMTKMTRHDFDIPNPGRAGFSSPLRHLRYEANAEFVTDDEQRVLFDYLLDKVEVAIEEGNRRFPGRIPDQHPICHRRRWLIARGAGHRYGG